MIQIVIADDHQSLLDGLKLQLKDTPDIALAGTANDGEQLLDIIRLKQPHVVITDIRMPKMDGITVTKQIKQEFPHIKIMALSMFDQADAVKQMLNAGVDGYILKNAPLKEVVNAIKTLSQGKKYFDSQIDTEDLSIDEASTDYVLTKRQLQILKLIGDGLSSREIADKLSIGVYTVDTHRKNMSRILGLQGRGELMRYALDRKYDF